MAAIEYAIKDIFRPRLYPPRKGKEDTNEKGKSKKAFFQRPFIPLKINQNIQFLGKPLFKAN